MNVEYIYSFDLPRTIVWKYIKNEKVLRNSISNCKSLKEGPTGTYHAEIDVKLGPMQDVFSIELHLQKEKSPAFYQLRLKGKGKLGQVDGAADVFFQPIDGGTMVKLLGEAQLTGALAVVGQRAFSGGADKSLEQFFKTVEKEIKKCLYHNQKGR